MFVWSCASTFPASSWCSPQEARRRWLDARHGLFRRASEVEVHLGSGLVIEDENLGLGVVFQVLPSAPQKRRQFAGRNASVAGEGRVGG